LFEQWQSTFNFENSRGLNMFIPDVPPEVPPQDAPMMMVVASADDDKHRTVGACRVLQNLRHGRENLSNGLTPDTSAGLYFQIFESTKIGYEGKVTLLRGPEHGVLELIGVHSWDYLPNKADYLGFDSATFLVEIEGYTVELTYGIKVVDSIGSGYEGATIHEYPENCPNGEYWKISPDGEIIPLEREEELDEWELLEDSELGPIQTIV
jgi:hypothetical protein